jgi:outer membrane biosynthesis protein TonB
VRAGKRQQHIVLVLALLAVAVTAHADYKDDYSHGVKAFRDGQYAQAKTLIQQALNDHPEPAVRVKLYGMVFEPYVPQHYLGMAAFKLNDCATAMAQWNSSANRQVVSQLPDISSQEQSGIGACEGQGVAKTTEKPATPQTATPDTTPAKPPIAEPPKVVVADNKQIKQVPPPPKPVEAPPPKPVAEKPAAEKPAVAAKSGPPEPLVQAFDNYLKGSYAEVTRINADSYADTRARYQAYLVRSASKYTLAKISADDAMLKGAGADALAAKALDARATPDATMFSPGFRAFYQESR